MASVIIFGAGTAATALAQGLGAPCVGDESTDPAAMLADTRRLGGGRFDAAIIPLEAPVDDGAGFAGLSDSAWRAACELPLRRARIALQTAHRALEGRGGRILFVVPTSALTGDGGSVAASAAAEGVRALGKSAAQDWRAEGISVNFIAVDAATLRNADAIAREIVPLVGLMLQCAPRITGSTIVADGGSAMVP